LVLPAMESLYGFAVTSFELVFKKTHQGGYNTITADLLQACELIFPLDKTSLQQ